MKSNYNIILVIVLAISTFSCTILFINKIFFPFTEVGVGDTAISAPTSFSPDSNLWRIPSIYIYLEKEFGDEYATILDAAIHNGCTEDNLLILFAIRKAENGGSGIEFGIEEQRGTNLNTQAGWAAATIIKNRERWENSEGYDELFGVEGFIYFLGQKYCPLNSEVWIRNVTHWYQRFKNEENRETSTKE